MRSNVILFIKPQKESEIEASSLEFKVTHDWIKQMPFGIWNLNDKDKELLWLFVKKEFLSKEEIKKSRFKQENIDRLLHLKFISYYDTGRYDMSEQYCFVRLDVIPPEPSIKFSFELYKDLLDTDILNLPNSYLSRTAKAITLCNSSESCLEKIWDKSRPSFGEIIDFLEWPYTVNSLKRAWIASEQVMNLILLMYRREVVIYDQQHIDPVCEIRICEKLNSYFDIYDMDEKEIGWACSELNYCPAREECYLIYESARERLECIFDLNLEIHMFDHKEIQRWDTPKQNQKKKLRLPPGISQGASSS